MIKIEQHAVTAWPAIDTERTGGWLLRHTPGVTRRRNNAALPPAADRHPERSIDAVESYYRSRGAAVTVQVSPAEEHAALDAALADRGYRHDAPTLVMTASAATITDRLTPVTPVEITPELTPAWRAAYGSAEVSDLVLSRITAPTGFASITVDGEIAAFGLFVAGDGLTGVFCMATAPAHRRRGYAAAILHAGAAWSTTRGARTLYLQVETDNDLARRLYEAAGFTHSHSYHYRIL
ncbi:GNAT family N-acetyltransferase [Actinoplanes hulinensis]|uniref:GNAT family N-acetyltransferase n=1 Tax=Actinoplanes hulinensis TaxID=1144547 RepID=A0ABS7B3I1_9ACTN|nr:GNAT family N-acetyltransferase [Actinoplanes hulinensis]MBW6435581.1 GNAT family N-acetyltransferase [Actinoplanes hulinensis]